MTLLNFLIKFNIIEIYKNINKIFSWLSYCNLLNVFFMSPITFLHIINAIKKTIKEYHL